MPEVKRTDESYVKQWILQNWPNYRHLDPTQVAEKALEVLDMWYVFDDEEAASRILDYAESIIP